MQQNNFIAEFTENFGLRIINMYKYVRENRKEYIMSKQVYRSGTSIGANVAESKNAQSKADFINKLSIALKEADETMYWLNLLRKSETISQDEYLSITNELNIIIGTLIKIIKKTKENMAKGK